MSECQVEALSNQHASLTERATQRQSDVVANQHSIQHLTQALNLVWGDIDKASSTLDAMGPAGGNVTTVKALQEELKVLLCSVASFNLFTLTALGGFHERCN